MPVISTFDKTVSDWLKREFWTRAGYTRKEVTVNEATGYELKTGTVLASYLANGAETITPDAGNTGDGTVGSVTVGGGAEVGTYEIEIISAAVDAGDFIFKDPDGNVIAYGTVGTAVTADDITFTVNDGATDFVVGDKFYVAIAGDVKYKKAVETATDGTDVPDAIFYGYGTELQPTVTLADATDAKVIVLEKGPAVVAKSQLVLDATYDDDTKKQAVYDALEALGINVDTSL